MLAEAQDREETGGGGGLKSKGCGGRKEEDTYPAWMALLGPSAGGRQLPAEAFHPPGQSVALEKGGREQN